MSDYESANEEDVRAPVPRRREQVTSSEDEGEDDPAPPTINKTPPLPHLPTDKSGGNKGMKLDDGASPTSDPSSSADSGKGRSMMISGGGDNPQSMDQSINDGKSILTNGGPAGDPDEKANPPVAPVSHAEAEEDVKKEETDVLRKPLSDLSGAGGVDENNLVKFEKELSESFQKPSVVEALLGERTVIAESPLETVAGKSLAEELSAVSSAGGITDIDNLTAKAAELRVSVSVLDQDGDMGSSVDKIDDDGGITAGETAGPNAGEDSDATLPEIVDGISKRENDNTNSGSDETLAAAGGTHSPTPPIEINRNNYILTYENDPTAAEQVSPNLLESAEDYANQLSSTPKSDTTPLPPNLAVPTANASSRQKQVSFSDDHNTSVEAAEHHGDTEGRDVDLSLSVGSPPISQAAHSSILSGGDRLDSSSEGGQNDVRYGSAPQDLGRPNYGSGDLLNQEDEGDAQSEVAGSEVSSSRLDPRLLQPRAAHEVSFSEVSTLGTEEDNLTETEGGDGEEQADVSFDQSTPPHHATGDSQSDRLDDSFVGLTMRHEEIGGLDEGGDMPTQDQAQQGDGAAPPGELDLDEDRTNPAFIPKKGKFYMHDSRDGGGDDRDERVTRKQEQMSRKWQHDMYNEFEQAPKATREIVNAYGYNIRSEDKAPQLDGNRKYTRPARNTGGGRRSEPPTGLRDHDNVSPRDPPSLNMSAEDQFPKLQPQEQPDFEYDRRPPAGGGGKSEFWGGPGDNRNGGQFPPAKSGGGPPPPPPPVQHGGSYRGRGGGGPPNRVGPVGHNQQPPPVQQLISPRSPSGAGPLMGGGGGFGGSGPVPPDPSNLPRQPESLFGRNRYPPSGSGPAGPSLDYPLERRPRRFNEYDEAGSGFNHHHERSGAPDFDAAPVRSFRARGAIRAGHGPGFSGRIDPGGQGGPRPSGGAVRARGSYGNQMTFANRGGFNADRGGSGGFRGGGGARFSGPLPSQKQAFDDSMVHTGGGGGRFNDRNDPSNSNRYRGSNSSGALLGDRGRGGSRGRRGDMGGGHPGGPSYGDRHQYGSSYDDSNYPARSQFGGDHNSGDRRGMNSGFRNQHHPDDFHGRGSRGGGFPRGGGQRGGGRFEQQQENHRFSEPRQLQPMEGDLNEPLSYRDDEEHDGGRGSGAPRRKSMEFRRRPQGGNQPPEMAGGAEFQPQEHNYGGPGPGGRGFRSGPGGGPNRGDHRGGGGPARGRGRGGGYHNQPRGGDFRADETTDSNQFFGHPDHRGARDPHGRSSEHHRGDFEDQHRFNQHANQQQHPPPRSSTRDQQAGPPGGKSRQDQLPPRLKAKEQSAERTLHADNRDTGELSRQQQLDMQSIGVQVSPETIDPVELAAAGLDPSVSMAYSMPSGPGAPQQVLVDAVRMPRRYSAMRQQVRMTHPGPLAPPEMQMQQHPAGAVAVAQPYSIRMPRMPGPPPPQTQHYPQPPPGGPPPPIFHQPPPGAPEDASGYMQQFLQFQPQSPHGPEMAYASHGQVYYDPEHQQSAGQQPLPTRQRVMLPIVSPQQSMETQQVAAEPRGPPPAGQQRPRTPSPTPEEPTQNAPAVDVQ